MKTESAEAARASGPGSGASANQVPGAAAVAANPKRWWVLIVVSLAQFIIAIDSSVVNVMGPRLKESIGLSTTGLQWVMNIYVLLFGGLLLLGGRLADVVGRKAVFISGLTVFTIASFTAGFAHSEGQLLASRAAQGIAAAALSPASLSILVTSFPDPSERSKAFGIWGAVIGIGASVGTIIGGAIANADWRWAFWINVPIGLVVGLGALALVTRSTRSGPRPPVDLIGAFTATAGVLLLVYGIVTTDQHGWGSATTLGCFAGAIVCLIAFVVVESRSKAPLVPLRLFRSRAVVSGALGEFLTAGLMMPLFFLIPLYLQNVLGYSTLQTGLAWIPTSLGLMICAPLASQLITKIGARPMYLLGTLVLGGTLAVAIAIPQHSSFWGFMLPLSGLFGVGLVLCLIATPVVGTSQATEEDAGTTSALLNASTQLGAAFGLAIAVTVFNNRVTHQLASGHSAGSALVSGISIAATALLVMLGLSVLNGLFGFRGLGKPDPAAAKAPGH